MYRASRERYYAAIELDENYVEARANLGCVLAELGERELAVAAFEGALTLHADYADAHFHLARTLDELKRGDEAAPALAGISAPGPRKPLGRRRARTARQNAQRPHHSAGQKLARRFTGPAADCSPLAFLLSNFT